MKDSNSHEEVRAVSIRQLILTIQDYAKAILRGWPWLLLAGVLYGGYRMYETSQRPVYWVAQTTFVVNNDQESGGGGLGAVLGRFGLGGGGGGGGGENLNRIMSFATSKYMLNRMFLDSAEISGSDDLIVNHIIRGCNLEETYQLEEYYGITKITAPTIEEMPIQERRLLKAVYGHITASNELPLATAIEQETGILSIITKTQEEELSLFLSTAVYHYTSDFYTEESTGQSKATVERLQVKADSILGELNAAEFQLAKFSDTKLSLANQRDQTRTFQLNRKIQILTLAYGEIVRNLETAKFALSSNTPFFQLVDEPFTPLQAMYPKPLKAGIQGAIIGMILASVLVAAVHFYREVMREETEEN